MKNLSISSRFVLFTAILLMAVIATISIVTVNRAEQTIQAAERQQLEQYYHQILGSLEFEGKAAQAMSALVAGIPTVQQAFAERDLDTLKALFAPGFEQLEEEYGVRQFQFHTPPATSFLRVHKLEKQGDDLSSFRHTVVETNRSRKPIRGLEVGVAGLGIRGIVPMFHQNRHFGSVEFGMSFGQSFFDEYKAAQNIDLALYLHRDGRFEAFGTTLGERALLNDAQMRQAFDGQTFVTRTELRGTPVAVYANVVKDYSGTPIGVLELAADRSFYAAEVAGIRNTILALGAGATLIAVLIALVIARNITRALERATRSMEDIAQGEGDLTRRLPVEGSAEVARLAQAFNRFVERIAATVESVSDAAIRLSSMVDRFSASADQTHRGMRHQQSETEQIAAAVNQMSATVHEVANNTAQAATAASDADKQAIQGQHVVAASIEAIEEVSREVQRVAEVITRVDQDSTRIGTVLDVIGEIAEQTNLLALNAAIEAARAGEQGRGFAVVADEVRVLAQRTQKSTEEIREMIESLQKGAKQAVSVMEQGRKRTEESVTQASAAGDALAAIARAVDTINQMNTQIATAAEEQSAVSDEINRNIARISEVTDNTAREAADTSHESERLVKLAEELLRLVRQFRLGAKDLDRDLEAAKAAHLAWKVKLRGFLDGREALTTAQAVSDRDCAFGKWYFGEGLERFGHVHAMKEVQQPHAEMHQLIKRIIDLKNAGKMAEAEREYAKVEPLSARIVELIERIRQQSH